MGCNNLPPRILHNKFKAQIVTPMERELMAARAEISFLSGVLQEGSPEYALVMQTVHNEFRSEGVTVTAIHTRRKRFDKMPGELRALEDELSRSVPNARAALCICIDSY